MLEERQKLVAQLQQFAMAGEDNQYVSILPDDGLSTLSRNLKSPC